MTTEHGPTPSHRLLPIHETVEAIEEYGPFSTDSDLLVDLQAQGARVQQIAPGCIGMSVSAPRHGVTFTLVATEEITGGPAKTERVDGEPAEASGAGAVPDEDDLLSEERWRVLAATAGSRGVASSLSLPLTEDGRVVGSINLYGAEPATFHGHVDALAQALGAWAAGAVTNADLAFDSLEQARAAPAHLREETVLGVAAGLLATAFSCSIGEAEERLRRGALQAGISTTALAEALGAAYRGS